MHENTEFNTTREVEAIQIPSGQKTTIPAGTPGVITQTLGGSYTIATYQGLARIAEKDLDALGLENLKSTNGEKAARKSDEPVDEKAVWDQLRQCYDPEIPVNIVDLGLVYSVNVAEVEPEDGRPAGKKVSVRFALTAPGCGMGDVLKQDIIRKVNELPHVVQADVDVTFDPPSTQDLMSDAARLQIGLM